MLLHEIYAVLDASTHLHGMHMRGKIPYLPEKDMQDVLLCTASAMSPSASSDLNALRDTKKIHGVRGMKTAWRMNELLCSYCVMTMLESCCASSTHDDLVPPGVLVQV